MKTGGDFVFVVQFVGLTRSFNALKAAAPAKFLPHRVGRLVPRRVLKDKTNCGGETAQGTTSINDEQTEKNEAKLSKPWALRLRYP